VSASKIHPQIAEKALKVLVPFITTYLCEVGFSSMLTIKNEKRNCLDLQSDLRCALSKTEPDISKLAQKPQLQPSH